MQESFLVDTTYLIRNWLEEYFATPPEWKSESCNRFKGRNHITSFVVGYGMLSEDLFFEVSVGRFMDVVLYGLTFNHDRLESRAFHSIEELSEFLRKHKDTEPGTKNATI